MWLCLNISSGVIMTRVNDTCMFLSWIILALFNTCAKEIYITSIRPFLKTIFLKIQNERWSLLNISTANWVRGQEQQNRRQSQDRSKNKKKKFLVNLVWNYSLSGSLSDTAVGRATTDWINSLWKRLSSSTVQLNLIKWKCDNLSSDGILTDATKGGTPSTE